MKWVHDNLLFAEKLWGSYRVPPQNKVNYSGWRVDKGKVVYMRVRWDEYGVVVDLDMHAENGVLAPTTILIISSVRRGEGWKWAAHGLKKRVELLEMLTQKACTGGNNSRTTEKHEQEKRITLVNKNVEEGDKKQSMGKAGVLELSGSDNLVSKMENAISKIVSYDSNKWDWVREKLGPGYRCIWWWS